VYPLPDPQQWAADGKPWIVATDLQGAVAVFDTQDEATQYISDHPGHDYDLTGPPDDYLKG
jgi:hypothetical protein